MKDILGHGAVVRVLRRCPREVHRSWSEIGNERSSWRIGNIWNVTILPWESPHGRRSRINMEFTWLSLPRMPTGRFVIFAPVQIDTTSGQHVNDKIGNLRKESCWKLFSVDVNWVHSSRDITLPVIHVYYMPHDLTLNIAITTMGRIYEANKVMHLDVIRYTGWGRAIC